MKSYVSLFLAVVSLTAFAQIKTPSPSPSGSVSTTVGLTDVKIDYSRPRAKGRKIFGEGANFLVSYGSIWRTGANNGTFISFSDDVTVEGNKIAAGKYLIYTWPGASEWTVSLYKDLDLGGNITKYDASKEAAKFKVKPEKLAEKIETLTFNIGDISDDSKTAKVQLMWENTSVKFTIGVDFDSKVMESIAKATGSGGGAYYQAASYYFDNGKDLKQALDWATIASLTNKDAFWVWLLKAKIQKALGDKKGAMESSMTSKAAAEKASNAEYVKMNEELQKTLK
ncbi:MAG: hypothetical protein OJF59_002412 [Cytophagales bacterium]|jgi:hypothetical protein|nr:DUF2911 domain-containing protein [Bacteroidota bacterium]MBS1980147.1 DUF2911 domain-containing protein [Bacteroidota bacterium]WHZ08658.1 MAG: hypothetical protein OJF59_002412 [Cytophagales bacterium]